MYYFFTYQYYFDFVSLKIQFGLAEKFGKNCQTSKLFRQMLLSFIQKIISKSLKQILLIQLCWGVKNHIGYILSVHNWQKNISSICTYIEEIFFCQLYIEQCGFLLRVDLKDLLQWFRNDLLNEREQHLQY